MSEVGELLESIVSTIVEMGGVENDLVETVNIHQSVIENLIEKAVELDARTAALEEFFYAE